MIDSNLELLTNYCLSFSDYHNLWIVSLTLLIISLNKKFKQNQILF